MTEFLYLLVLVLILVLAMFYSESIFSIECEIDY